MSVRSSVGKFVLAAGLMVGLIAQSHAAALFSENWNSGTINTAIWKFTSFTSTTAQGPSWRSSATLYNLGGNDNAALLIGYDDWSERIFTTGTAVFARGNNIRSTFQVWGSPGNNAIKDKRYNAVFPNAASINGPWHNNFDSGAHGGQEGGFSEWPGQPLRYEAGTWDNGPKLSQQYRLAYINTNGKGKSLWCRSWLGNTRGNFAEWSGDGGVTWFREDIPTSRSKQSEGGTGGGIANGATYSLSPSPGILTIDSRELLRDGDATTATRNCPTSRTSQGLRLGFGTLRAAILLDNILVESDGNTAAAGPQITVIGFEGEHSVRVSFNTAMGPGVLDPLRYTISGAGKGTLAANPSSVTLVSGNTYRLTWATGVGVNGQSARITFFGEDASGNPIALGVPSGTTIATPVDLSNFEMK